jgi:hypothetical protein
MRSRIVLSLVAAALVAGLLVAGAGLFGTDGSAPPQNTTAAAEGPNPLTASHVHGIARHPQSGEAYVATHDGLYVFGRSSPPRRVGPTIDLMGFTITEQGQLLASGHPGVGTDLPQPVGLIESADRGKSWTVRSRGGQSDFHAVSQSSAGILGYDGILRSSPDGRTWRDLSAPEGVTSLGASPDGKTVLAATGAELQISSTSGSTWAPTADAPALVLLDWADATRVVGVDIGGAVFVSSDAGRSWKRTGAQTLGPPQAVGASIIDGRVEILAVTHIALLISSDGGTTFAALR